MVRAILLGAGPAAARHARAFAALADGCALVGVHDDDPAAAAALTEATGVPVVEDLAAALASADVAVVAGTVDQRPALTRKALEQGLDVLVEPPLASAPDIAHGLLSAIVRAPRRPVAMVAYDEQFDPTVRELRALVGGQALISVHAERTDPAAAGPLPETDVVHDLMHLDIHFLLGLTGESISATQAAGRLVRRGGPIDHAQALLVMENDVVASLTASRGGATRARRLTVTTTHARVTADLDTRAVEAVRTTETGPGRTESIAQRIDVPSDDPAIAQARAFLRCVAHRTSPESGIGMAIASQEAAVAIMKRIELVAHRPALRRGPQAA